MGTCIECSSRSVARGLCSSHYAIHRKAGTLPDRKNRSAADWLQRSTGSGTGECWTWQGPRDYDGYGQAGHERAHRFSYERAVGPIAIGLTIDHLCRNRACVNPAHLEAVSIRTNVLRAPAGITAINHRKQICIRGHEFTPANTYSQPSKPRKRICRTCKAELQRLYRASARR